MNAYEIPGLRFSMPAGGAVARSRFVAVNSDGNGVQADANANIIGVSMNEVAKDEVLEIADGIVMVEAAGAITSGAKVYADADGKASATAVSSSTGGVAGIAITGGAKDTLVAIKLK